MFVEECVDDCDELGLVDYWPSKLSDKYCVLEAGSLGIGFRLFTLCGRMNLTQLPMRASLLTKDGMRRLRSR